MKKLIILSTLIFMFSCSKQDTNEPTCVTCELDVVQVLGVGISSHYVESTKQICDDSYKTYNGVTVDYGGTTSHGVTTNTKKTWNCK